LILIALSVINLFLQNQWKEMFPGLISKAATVDVISNGEGPNRNGAVQLVSCLLAKPFHIVSNIGSLHYISTT
jgi:hypothetical protein